MNKNIKFLSAATFIISAYCAAEYKEPTVIDSGDFYQTLILNGASSSGWTDVPFNNDEKWYAAIAGRLDSDYPDIKFANIDAQFKTQNGIYITQDMNIINSNAQPTDVGQIWYQNVIWSTGGESLAFVSTGGGVDEIYVDETSKLSSGERTVWIGEDGRLNSWLQNKGEIYGGVSGITNAGTASGLYNYGKIDGGIYGIELRDSAATQSVTNDGGVITGGEAGIINGGVIHERIYNSGTINGKLINSGVIHGDIYNSGIINGGLVNTGEINGYIINAGTITGDVNLGNAALFLGTPSPESQQPVVNGVITGSEKSAIQVGDTKNSAQFIATHDADVGTIGIGVNGELTLAKNISWSASDVYVDGILNLNDRSSISGQVNNDGILTLGNDGVTTSATVNGNLHNKGSVVLNQGNTNAGNVLIVTGDYTGEKGSQIHLSSALGPDSSSTDKMVINGNMKGSSEILVNNLGGEGDYTHDGIEIIHVDGMSEGQFTLGGRAVAGSYEYYLYKGDLKGENQNWYLRSELPPEATPEPAPGSDKVYRPEAGSYIAGIAASNTMFNIRLHDRAGETYYTNALTGERSVTSMWMNHIGGHNAWKDGSSQLKTQSNRYVLQLGGDIVQWTDSKDRLHIGVMGGYGNEKSTTTSSLSHYNSKGTVEGYSLGMYATWQQNKGDDTGAYSDVWAQYSWFENTVNGEQLTGETWKSRGITASTEAGYTFKAGEFIGSHGSSYNWYIQPQAQLTWMNVRSEDHRENNGTNVRAQGEGNTQSRLGARVFLREKSLLKAVKDRTFEPFIEANWIHNTRSWGVRMDDALVTQDGARDVGEIKTGIEGQLSENLNLWGNVGVQIGDKGYNNTQGTLGIKYSF